MKTLIEYISRTFENATPLNTTGMGDVVVGDGKSVGSEPPPTKEKKKRVSKKRKACCKEEE